MAGGIRVGVGIGIGIECRHMDFGHDKLDVYRVAHFGELPDEPERYRYRRRHRGRLAKNREIAEKALNRTAILRRSIAASEPGPSALTRQSAASII